MPMSTQFLLPSAKSFLLCRSCIYNDKQFESRIIAQPSRNIGTRRILQRTIAAML